MLAARARPHVAMVAADQATTMPGHAALPRARTHTYTPCAMSCQAANRESSTRVLCASEKHTRCLLEPYTYAADTHIVRAADLFCDVTFSIRKHVCPTGYFTKLPDWLRESLLLGDPIQRRARCACSTPLRLEDLVADVLFGNASLLIYVDARRTS